MTKSTSPPNKCKLFARDPNRRTLQAGHLLRAYFWTSTTAFRASFISILRAVLSRLTNDSISLPRLPVQSGTSRPGALRPPAGSARRRLDRSSSTKRQSMSVNDVPLPELQPGPDGRGPPRSPLSEERSTTGGALEGSLGEGLCGRHGRRSGPAG